MQKGSCPNKIEKEKLTKRNERVAEDDGEYMAKKQGVTAARAQR
jgi:hypothetical protein